MSIVRKVKAVEKIFAALDQEMNALRTSSGLHCISGCGKCCFKADIEASPLEFIPYAFHLYLTKRIDEAYQALLLNETSICALFAPVPFSLDKGSCSNYAYRGLICRLFGFSATRDKNGLSKLITCKILKETQGDVVNTIQKGIESDIPVPMMSDYYFRIRSIDPNLGTMMLPINLAMQKAMEVVMGYYAYRKPPRLGKLSA
uniref:YkgJ family cysteine cluster protein n=1 Tax=Roseivirga sp. TaxID=1964215 RepID=UPI00404849DE